MTPRLFVSGASGQVATALVERAPRAGASVRAVGRPELDLETMRDIDRIAGLIAASGATAVVSAAAYTAVDRAESEPERAFAINRDGAGALAAAARRLGLPLVHLSTDYVYDGLKPAPYVETDPTGPTGVYGRSKLDGEAAVAAAHPDALILRTAWVYAPFGANFVRTVLRLSGERDRLRVVDDQVGNPTSALDIADAILAIAARLAAEGRAGRGGVYHLAGAGETTWCGFARAIMRLSAERGGPAVPVDAIATADYPTPAARPANSRLDGTKLARSFGLGLPSWTESLPPVIDRLVGGPVVATTRGEGR